ncbi:MAG: ABC transporter substrate-binding protein [Bacteroidetes bacterium]|nr:ABC transporter substrate-binding protein [Bacteroidota bacterium]MCA6443226.1 ABC transporter substrate-binding protein [Bacteroidota bacterium]
MFTKTNYFVSIFFLICFLACKDHKEQKEIKKIFSYNEMAVVTSLDPAAASNFENIWPVNQIFNGLVQMDDELNVLPSIAKKFSISSDGLVYTFDLRTDVFFHANPCFTKGEGRKVIAKDFVFSFTRLFDSKVSSATTLLNCIDRSEKTNYKGFEAINDSTFKIHLTKPYSAFLNILTMKYFSVVPHEAIDYYGESFRTNPVGTGPFTFKKWEEGTRIILQKNPNYFERDEKNERLPYLDGVNISFIKDRETAFMELLNGKFDMLSGADAFNTMEVLTRDAELKDTYQKRFYLQKTTFLKTDYIGILLDEKIDYVKNSPLRLKAIRQAINYAFDREKLVKFIRNGIGVPATCGFIPKGMRSYNPALVKGYYYDPNKVKQLLAEAGYPNGENLPELVIHAADNFKEALEFIQSQLGQNNIKVQISIEKPSVLKQAVNACEYNLFKKSWVGDYGDEENFMNLFYSKNFAPQGVNYFHYNNPKFDDLYEKALVATTDSAKIDLYQKMEMLIIDDAPVIPLYYDEVIRIVDKNISGLSINPMNLLNLKTVRK